ncbi:MULTISPECIES: TetR/AcrR family transcriptional regulator [Thermoactinomyces]|jgi:TetR/AcrR family transcriptional regulator, transcriptional repressor for nem operon|uniref:TetR/AcrR family transcriptional regulator n=1 Tax=Thermoactinomyces TaxID=2023 RepID=UPI00051A5551|nr:MULTISPECIES: TetR/AcrR family transcriptional regulator [Thermoactinomyces]
MKHQEMTERTIRKLMDAGIVLFAKYGYSNTSINQIVKEAGLSKGAFYAHFPTKEDFLMKVLRHDLSVLAQVQKELADQMEEWRQDLTRLFEVMKKENS